MATTATIVFYFTQPWWLALAAVLGPLVIWTGLRNLSSLSTPRRVLVVALRVALIVLLSALLARPMWGRKNDSLTLLTVVDRSKSVPDPLLEKSLDDLNSALTGRSGGDRLAVVDVAEAAAVSRLPALAMHVPRRNTDLAGEQSCLDSGLQMALAIAPPESGARILFISDGNQTSGDLRALAQTAAANHVPIDVLPLRYEHAREVVFTRLAAPHTARSKQTITLRFVLTSTTDNVPGRLHLTHNGQTVHLDPSSDKTDAPVVLRKGLNVRTISLPVGTRGIQDFRADFIPDRASDDRLSQNNHAGAMTFVSGAGHVLLVEAKRTCDALTDALTKAQIEVRRVHARDFPTDISGLVDADCVILANVSNGEFSLRQQEMICRFVTDVGGGLIMTGGPDSFGAGGWIGSPLASVLPVDLDPPQKLQMPQGALMLVIDRSGSMSGQKLQLSKAAAVEAVRLLSARDYVGVVSFDSLAEWAVKPTLLHDKQAVFRQIRMIPEGGGTDIFPGLEQAHEAIRKLPAGQKHIILLTDGQSAGKDVRPLAQEIAKSRITVSTVAVGADADFPLLAQVAQITKGRAYKAQDPQQIPAIFIKEAQVVRRALIVEEPFTPAVSFGLSELVKGLSAMPQLEGYVLTGQGGGLHQTVLKSKHGDPVLASGQFGLGRSIAFTSSADVRWGQQWVHWGEYASFWVQAVRWCGKTASSGDCDIFADVQDRQVDICVETTDSDGRIGQFAGIGGQVIAPDMTSKELELRQVGSGRYRAHFTAQGGGNYLVNLQYTTPDSSARRATQCVVTVPHQPEFRDIADNAPLLAELATMTGGRILQGKYQAGDLFSREGVVFPQTVLPMTALLAAVCIGAFLLDVGVRRIALDWKAVARRVRALLPRAAGQQKDQAIDRLQARRQQVRKQMDRQAKDLSSRRFEMSPEAAARSSQDLPVTNATPPPPERAPAQPSVPAASAPPPTDDSTMGRLLKAKRRAGDPRHPE